VIAVGSFEVPVVALTLSSQFAVLTSLLQLFVLQLVERIA
jgi:hypothetical protein